MKKSRVERFADYRKEILTAANEQKQETIDETMEQKDPFESEIKKNALSHTMEEIIQKHDEYTIMMDASQINEKKSFEEKTKKKEMNKKILYLSLYIGLAIIAIVLIILIILLLVK